MCPNRRIAVLITILIFIAIASVLNAADPDNWFDVKAYREQLSGKDNAEHVISLNVDTIWIELRQRENTYWIYNYNPSTKFEVYVYSTVDLGGFSLGFAMNRRLAYIDTAYLSPIFSEFSHAGAFYANDRVFYDNDTVSYVLFGAVDTMLSHIDARDTFYLGTCEFSIREDMLNPWFEEPIPFWFDSAFIPPGGDFILVSWNGEALLPTVFNTDTLLVRMGGAVDDMEINRVPSMYELRQNYPNPFNPSTTIEFFVKTQSFVQLDIYNILGHKVRALVNEPLEPGWQTVQWDGLDDIGDRAASGIYFYQLKIGDYMESKKMILVK